MLRKIINQVNLASRWVKHTFSDKIINRGKFTILLLLRTLYKISNAVIPFFALSAGAIIIYDFGFNSFYSHETSLYKILIITLQGFKILFLTRFICEWVEIKKITAHLYSFALIVLTFYLYRVGIDIRDAPIKESTGLLFNKLVLYGGIFFLFLTEASGLLRYLYRKRQNTAFLFILSFAIIIVAGALLLLVPKATVHGISRVDALFTATSAVCVTGLTVIDTAQFTPVGKVIILLLIQIGGLGIMTFTGLLTYLAAGSVSFHNQIALKSIVSSNRISNVMTIVGRIIIVTLLFEGLGAFLIFSYTDAAVFDKNIDHVFFALFHSISAFCNAGFSTLSQGLNESIVKYNYSLHLIIAVLIILGGMGFPIVFNIYSFFRTKAINLINQVFKNPTREVYTRIIQVNSKLALWTTFSLLLIGFVCYFIFEIDASLQEHPTWTGKVVTAFFGSVTPRTAGFNTVNLNTLSMPIILIYFLLMWIGASPSSTGGGIKTTTFAVAFLNLRTLISGKNRVEIFRTQLSDSSVNRAFAIISLSLFIIGLATLVISLNDSRHGLLKIAFESFSAFSTVGLTLGITPELSDVSKIVLIIVMFIGRVGALTLLMAFASQVSQKHYQYPIEEVMY
jgi:trk system potassium uptake protein